MKEGNRCSYSLLQSQPSWSRWVYFDLVCRRDNQAATLIMMFAAGR